MLPSPWTSSLLGFKCLTDEIDGLGERAGPDTESAFDDARLAADVLRHIEDRRLALAERTHHFKPMMVA